MSINRGAILLNRLYHTCYIHTIDWGYLYDDGDYQQPTVALTNNECINEQCHLQCSNNCWSSNENDCQLKCPAQCKKNCFLNEAGKCCENQLCMFCESVSATSKCVSCSMYRDLSTGECVNQCDKDMLLYENHSCIKHEDCSRNKNSLIKGYHVLGDVLCVRECPEGFTSEISARLNASVCVKCPDNICRKDCSAKSFTIKSLFDLSKIKNCFRVKRLHIEFNNINATYDDLKYNLQYLEEIEDYLVIVRNKYLKTLSFLKHLRLIGGDYTYFYA